LRERRRHQPLQHYVICSASYLAGVGEEKPTTSLFISNAKDYESPQHLEKEGTKNEYILLLFKLISFQGASSHVFSLLPASPPPLWCPT